MSPLLFDVPIFGYSFVSGWLPRIITGLHPRSCVYTNYSTLRVSTFLRSISSGQLNNCFIESFL